jgi:E1A/CREB-binding protein
MSHTGSVGDASGPATRPQVEKNSQELQEENMGTSLLEYFSVDLIEKHLRIVSEPDVANPRLQKTRTATNLVADQLAAEDSNCKVCQQNNLLFEAPCINCDICYAKINRNTIYYSTPKNCDIRATLCHSCVRKSGDTIQLQWSHLLRKHDMEKKKNDAMPGEDWVRCDSCQEWVHQICGLFNKGRNDGKRVFSCPWCLLTGLRNGKRTISENRPQAMLTAKDLPPCSLSNVLEKRLSEAIEKERDARANAMSVHPSTLETVPSLTVRVVNNVEKNNEVKPKFAGTFCGGKEEKPYNCIHKYKQKVILLFQEVDGVDLCLFCMYMQEYGDDCPAPNNRTGISFA